MNTPEFEKIVQERTEKITDVFVKKAKEYAQAGDRLHHFKVAARMKGESEAKALWGMAVKHLVNVEDLVEGRLEPTPHYIDEKIGDMINYLILLEALLLEKEQK